MLVWLRLSIIYIFAQLLFALSPPSGNARDLQLQWDPNSEVDLAGYRVYCWNDSGHILNPALVSYSADVNNVTTAMINGLSPYLTYYVAVTAYNEAGLESGFSNLISLYPEYPCPLGDISGDGYVDISDVMLALKIAVGKINPSNEQLACGDVAPVRNGVLAPNGRIDTGDAIVMMSKMVGKVIF